MRSHATALFLAVLVQGCTPFQLSSPSSPPKLFQLSTRSPAIVHVLSASVRRGYDRPSTTCWAGSSSGRDGGGGEDSGDGVDYSADPLTAFLGKFLPSGGEKSMLPRAENLVGGDDNGRGTPYTCVLVTHQYRHQ